MSERLVTADDILRVVSEHLGTPREQIVGPERAHTVTFARHVVEYLLREKAHRSLSWIGRTVGGQHHTTVLYGIRRVERERRYLPEVELLLEELERKLA